MYKCKVQRMKQNEEETKRRGGVAQQAKKYMTGWALDCDTLFTVSSDDTHHLLIKSEVSPVWQSLNCLWAKHSAEAHGCRWGERMTGPVIYLFDRCRSAPPPLAPHPCARAGSSQLKHCLGTLPARLG